MKIATVSLMQRWEDKTSNLQLCERYIKEAVNQNVNLIVFPEMTLTGFTINIDKTAENEEQSETINDFKRLAKRYTIAILFGVVISDRENKALNKSIFVDNAGTILGDYTKIHPFSFSNEDKYFNSGKELKALTFNGYKIGLSICYDLRFPELYSALSKESDIIINIANWPKKRVNHWKTLLKSRAIENQIFIIGVNRIGTDGNGLEYEESSMVYNADGEMLRCINTEDMKVFTVEKEWTKYFTDNFSTVQDRKTTLYKEII